jgi:hypothetical protein
MRIQHIGAVVLLGIGLCGCGGPAAGPQGDVDHWLSKVPAGATENEARNTLADNDFSKWSMGRVIYANRDKVASADYSDSVTMQIHTNDEHRVSSSDAASSPVSPYPMLAPTYP